MQILITIAYEGTNYCGWQRQKNGVSVQQTLEEALSALYGRGVALTGASRTDAGVHALGQSACFRIDHSPIPTDKLPFALRSVLPPDISVTGARAVPDAFHPRFDAREKTYEYTIYNSPHQNPLLRRVAWHVYDKLDVGAMRAAAALMTGKHDYAAFCASGHSASSTTRVVYETSVAGECGGIIKMTVRGQAFLYNMVRIMAGTAVYAGIGKISPGDVPGIIEARDRTRAGKTAPAHGLLLKEVKYDL